MTSPLRGGTPKKAEAERPRIMVVDDDERAAEIFHDKLEHSGYEVQTAASAEEALGQIKRFQPSVVITDLRMPGMSGLDLLARVREHMPGTEVIVVTGHVGKEVVLLALELKTGKLKWRAKIGDPGKGGGPTYVGARSTPTAI